MGADHPVTVLGDSGPAVLLLPGGAETVQGFFPGLPEGLLADPGCRIVVYDRPGTGHSTLPGSLATASADLHAVLADLDLGPVVVIGQSLGGAVAELLACDHPEDVAGLMLLDPTPVNDPALAARVESTMRRLERLSHVPVLGHSVQGLLRSTARRSARRHEMTPEVRKALFAAADADLPQLANAVVGLGDIAREFDESRLPHVPSIVVTADRPERSAVRRAHVRLADALGAQLMTWPKAEHHVHLSHPADVLKAARELLKRVPAR